MDRKFILWNHPRMALQKTIRRYRNAKIRPQEAPHIWKTTTKTSTAHAIGTDTNKLRTKSDTIIHEDPGKLLGDANKNYIQQVLGIFLYYAQAIDMTILLALNDITT